MGNIATAYTDQIATRVALADGHAIERAGSGRVVIVGTGRGRAIRPNTSIYKLDEAADLFEKLHDGTITGRPVLIP